MRSSNALLPGKGFHIDALLAPQAALAAFFGAAEVRLPRVESVALDDCTGRILAQDIVAENEVPLHPRSSMDGFALRASVTPGTFEVVGSVRMGHTFEQIIGDAQCVEIPTGGALPPGCDCVVPIEEVEREGRRVIVSKRITPGECLSRAGEDIASGERVLLSGTRIGAPQISVLATLGHDKVNVFARPRIGVLSCGDELTEIDAPAHPARVRDSNGPVLASALRGIGASAVRYPIIRDDLHALRDALVRAHQENDAVMLSGGSSVGERDYTPRAIAQLGKPGVIVHGLRVKPGKPTVLAAADGKPVIGLPGNPVSALMILLAVVRPIVAALLGERESRSAFPVWLGEALSKRAGWTWYVPVTLQERGDRFVAMPLPMRSSWTSLLAHADAFVVAGEEYESLQAGTTLWAHRFEELH